MSVCREVSDRLSTLEILKASECSSQHLKNAVISRVFEFYGCRNVSRRKDTHYKCRDSVLSVSIPGLQGFRASVSTVSKSV